MTKYDDLEGGLTYLQDKSPLEQKRIIVQFMLVNKYNARIIQKKKG